MIVRIIYLLPLALENKYLEVVQGHLTIFIDYSLALKVNE